MKIFAIYGKVNLINKPDWLDAFRKKFDKPYEYHVTLKQPCTIENNQVKIIQDNLQNLFSDNNFKALSLTFNRLNIPKEPDDLGEFCIMINSNDNESITYLQKSILNELSSYRNYVKAKYEAYETNFQPHITIARDLSMQNLEIAKQELPENFICTGEISEIVLVVADEATVEQANDPANQTIYKL